MNKSSSVQRRPVSAGSVLGVVAVFALLGPPLGAITVVVLLAAGELLSSGLGGWNLALGWLYGGLFFGLPLSFLFGGLQALITGAALAYGYWRWAKVPIPLALLVSALTAIIPVARVGEGALLAVALLLAHVVPAMLCAWLARHLFQRKLPLSESG